jgi:hypothetical protein
MSGRYYSRSPSPTPRSQSECVQNLISGVRSGYNSDSRRTFYQTRLRNEKWRRERQTRLVSQLQGIGKKIDKINNAQLPRGGDLRTKQTELLDEVELLDLHSKHCWKKNRRRAFRDNVWHWLKRRIRRPPVRVLSKPVCYCQT